MYRTFVLTLSMACSATTAKTHEFWIDPVIYHAEVGEEVSADLRVGQEFEGSPQSFIPNNFRRFEYALNGKSHSVSGTVGDRPALALTPVGEGLMVVIHVTQDQRLTWSTWEKFAKFLNHKDVAWGLDEHDARGLSREKVRERYSRYAKSLIAVGNGEGGDIEAGLLTEIIALENPYTGNMSDGIDIQALYDGKTLTDTQIEVFEKSPSGEVTISTNRTDANGKATIPVKPGHQYMLDAVILRALEVEKETDPAWESLWANLTFEIPEN